jgi:hypothetical protein
MERLPMPQYTAYRARLGAVHHVNPQCPIGRQIPPDLLLEGAGGLPLCPTCRLRGQARPPTGHLARHEHADNSESSRESDPDDAQVVAPRRPHAAPV